MQPIVVTVGPLAAASANAIALSQTPAKGPLTLNGASVVAGIAVLDQARQVLITTTGNESAKTFTIAGTDWSGSAISETVTGPNVGTAASVLSYKTVTSVTISANAAAALTVGTNGVASSPWVRLDTWADATVGFQCVASGTVNYTLQQTYDDPNSPTNPVSPNAMTWVNCPTVALVNATATQQGNYAIGPVWARVVLNSGTGSVTSTFAQFESVGY